MSSHLKKLFTPFSFPWISSSGLAFGQNPALEKALPGPGDPVCRQVPAEAGIMMHLIVSQFDAGRPYGIRLRGIGNLLDAEVYEIWTEIRRIDFQMQQEMEHQPQFRRYGFSHYIIYKVFTLGFKPSHI